MSLFKPSEFERDARYVNVAKQIAVVRFLPQDIVESAAQRKEPSILTKKAFWESRYVLTEIYLELGDKSLKLNDAIVTVDASKTIEKTPLVGHKGTVKEKVTDNDYKINIDVGLVAVNALGEFVDAYPAEAVSRLLYFLEADEVISVTSPFFKLFDIDRMVVETYKIKQATDSNRQEISITALSDTPYDLKKEYTPIKK